MSYYEEEMLWKEGCWNNCIAVVMLCYCCNYVIVQFSVMERMRSNKRYVHLICYEGNID